MSQNLTSGSAKWSTDLSSVTSQAELCSQEQIQGHLYAPTLDKTIENKVRPGSSQTTKNHLKVPCSVRHTYWKMETACNNSIHILGQRQHHVTFGRATYAASTYRGGRGRLYLVRSIHYESFRYSTTAKKVVRQKPHQPHCFWCLYSTTN